MTAVMARLSSPVHAARGGESEGVVLSEKEGFLIPDRKALERLGVS